MDKKNTQPLIISPLLLPKQIYVDGDEFRPVTNEPVDQPQDPQDVVNQAAAKIGQGIKNGSLADVRAGAATITGVANVMHGGDPMRVTKTHPTNSEVIPLAYDEVNRYQSILRTEHPGVFRRLDIPRLGADMSALAEAKELSLLYQGRAADADKLVRHYENEVAPTLVTIYNDCRATILQHSDLEDKMPNLTKLAVGAQQDAAASRNNNNKIRDKAKEDNAAQPPPGAGATSPPAQTTTTVTTPTMATPAPAPAATPAPASAHRRSHTATPKKT